MEITDKMRAEAIEQQKRAGAAITEQLNPIIDGTVVLGIEAVVLISVNGHVASSRINLGRTIEAKTMVRMAAATIYAGALGEPVLVEHRAAPPSQPSVTPHQQGNRP